MRRRYSGDVTNEAPCVHLPGSPSALSEEEIAYKRRKRAYHEAALPAERRACDDADGADRLEIRDGREDDTTCCGKRGENDRGHDLPKRRFRALKTEEEHGDCRYSHDERQQCRLLIFAHCADGKSCGGLG